VSEEELEKLRAEIAEARGFDLKEVYSEQQASGFVRKDPSTFKRWRKRGIVEAIYQGPKNVYYRARTIADLILFGTGGK
jgi:hypothetical protein